MISISHIIHIHNVKHYFINNFFVLVIRCEIEIILLLTPTDKTRVSSLKDLKFQSISDAFFIKLIILTPRNFFGVIISFIVCKDYHGKFAWWLTYHIFPWFILFSMIIWFQRLSSEAPSAFAFNLKWNCVLLNKMKIHED